ncbi:MAG: glycosyltransferase [Pedobacter sp.]|nr:MAG: glycosyltransferase [Pedobacter sp.]
MKSKGFHTLLKAWLRLAQSGDRILWITGYPISEDKKTLALIQKTTARTDIVWLGTVDQQAIAKIYRAVNTVIIPSEVYEIGPLVFHEAIASGCKVISSDIGGCKELAAYYAERSVTFKAGNDEDLSIKIINPDTNKAILSQKEVLNFETHFKRVIAKSHFYN